MKREMRGKSEHYCYFKLLLFLFDSNDVSAVNFFEKVAVIGDGSSNSSPQPPEAYGSLAQRCGDLKNKAFFCVFWSRFLLKNVF